MMGRRMPTGRNSGRGGHRQEELCLAGTEGMCCCSFLSTERI